MCFYWHTTECMQVLADTTHRATVLLSSGHVQCTAAEYRESPWVGSSCARYGQGRQLQPSSGRP